MYYCFILFTKYINIFYNIASLFHCFIVSFIHLFIYSFIHLFIVSFIALMLYLFIALYILYSIIIPTKPLIIPLVVELKLFTEDTIILTQNNNVNKSP